jgi:hypothetical protein
MYVGEQPTRSLRAVTVHPSAFRRCRIKSPNSLFFILISCFPQYPVNNFPTFWAKRFSIATLVGSPFHAFAFLAPAFALIVTVYLGFRDEIHRLSIDVVAL